MMHRPAGMSSDEDSSDSEDMTLESSVPLNRQRKNFSLNDTFNSAEQQEDKIEVPLELDNDLKGNDSISSPDAEKRQDTLSQSDVNGHRCKTKLPLDDVGNWSFHGDETSYIEHKDYIKTDSHGKKPHVSFKRSCQEALDWRKFQMHQGVAFPTEELRMAVMQGNITVVKSLFVQGVAVDQILKGGWTALMFAASCGRHEMVQYLLQQGADPNMHKEMFTPLMAACAARQDNEEGVVKCVNYLVDFGAKVNSCERHRMTALMFACKEGRTSVVDRLIQAKADVNKQDNKGWTALCWAATKNHGIVVRKLLEASADPSKMNIHGQRPADVAMAAGHVQLADILDRATSGGSAKDSSLQDEKSLMPLIANGRVHLSPHFGEMEMVLSGLDLQDIIPVFQANKVTLECFLRLTDNDLEKMGISAVGTRKVLLETIAHIHKQEWKTTSLPNLVGLPYITVPDAIAMVANINRHLRFIHASVGHLRDQIQATPRILELGQEKHTVGTLSQEFEKTLKNLSNLADEVKFFKIHLDKVCNNAEYASADTIVIKRDDGRQWQRRLCASLVIATSCFTVIYFWKPRTFSWLFSLSPYPQKSVFMEIP